MNDRGDIKARIKRELEMVDTSTLVSDTTIEDAIQDAYYWATDLYPWPRTEKAKYTTTTTDYYYDQPGEFKMDSIFLIIINNLEYDPTNYEDYLRFKRDNPNNSGGSVDDRLFAMFGDQVFIEPAVSAGLEMVVWGLIQPDPFVDDNSITIFSNTESAGNEGIMRKALSDLLPVSNPRKNDELIKAQNILDGLYKRIRNRQARFKRKDASFFNVPNLFPDGRQASTPGNFSRRP